jgi:hypothetical protein
MEVVDALPIGNFALRDRAVSRVFETEDIRQYRVAVGGANRAFGPFGVAQYVAVRRFAG